MHKHKALGLALGVLVTAGAAVASVASANQFHSAASGTTLTMASNAVVLFEYEPNQTVSCVTVGGSGAFAAKTVSEVTFAPTYSNCEFVNIAGSDVTVSMNGCDYRFTIEAAANKGPLHINCTGSNQITMTVKALGLSVCTLHIGAQTPSGGSTYSNNGSGRVDFSQSLTKISASRQGSSACGAATSTSGTYSDLWRLKGEETGQPNEVAVQVG